MRWLPQDCDSWSQWYNVCTIPAESWHCQLWVPQAKAVVSQKTYEVWGKLHTCARFHLFWEHKRTEQLEKGLCAHDRVLESLGWLFFVPPRVQSGSQSSQVKWKVCKYSTAGVQRNPKCSGKSSPKSAGLEAVESWNLCVQGWTKRQQGILKAAPKALNFLPRHSWSSSPSPSRFEEGNPEDVLHSLSGRHVGKLVRLLRRKIFWRKYSKFFPLWLPYVYLKTQWLCT